MPSIAQQDYMVLKSRAGTSMSVETDPRVAAGLLRAYERGTIFDVTLGFEGAHGQTRILGVKKWRMPGVSEPVPNFYYIDISDVNPGSLTRFQAKQSVEVYEALAALSDDAGAVQVAVAINKGYLANNFKYICVDGKLVEGEFVDGALSNIQVSPVAYEDRPEEEPLIPGVPPLDYGRIDTTLEVVQGLAGYVQ